MVWAAKVRAAVLGGSTLVATPIPTAKNKPCLDFFAQVDGLSKGAEVRKILADHGLRCESAHFGMKELTAEDTSLLELVDRLLNKGVVLAGEATISVAGIDLIYLGLNVVLAAVETIEKAQERRAS